MAVAMDKPTTLSRRELPKTTMIYIIVGVVVGLTCTVGVIVFLVIRHRKGQKYSQLRKRSTTATTNNNRESYRKSSWIAPPLISYTVQSLIRWRKPSQKPPQKHLQKPLQQLLQRPHRKLRNPILLRREMRNREMRNH
jgi:hypothetical protein